MLMYFLFRIILPIDGFGDTKPPPPPRDNEIGAFATEARQTEYHDCALATIDTVGSSALSISSDRGPLPRQVSGVPRRNSSRLHFFNDT
jgi:hypothetical protein